ncbi:MAG: hypothetical protein LBB84_02975 [Tannerellaceae bacterium]|jgi:hypothetical protein|nr:hypothetical protein [Tannerellaceae bacterium]
MKTIVSALLASICMASPVLRAQENLLPKEIIVGKERVKTRKEIRLPDIDGYRLLKCDFHMHTIFSDGIVWPTLRVHEAWEEGLDAIAITEHIEGQPARRGVEKGNHNYPFEIAGREALLHDILLIRGAEITRPMPPGHLNALFLKDINPLDQKDYMKALEEAHRQGAFIFWNHPGWGVKEIKWYALHDTLYQRGWLHGIEVYNEFEWYPQALNWANEKNLTLMANSDVHDVIERLYDFHTMPFRPMTLVLSKERTEEGIREALFARRTIAYFYNTLMGKEEWLEKFFHASVQIQSPHHTTATHRILHIKNTSDIPFLLRKTDTQTQAAQYPDKIDLPAGRSVLLMLPAKPETQSVVYEVENMIIAPERKLHVKIF